MKKQLLAFCGAMLLTISISQAQYFSRFYNDGKNPGGLNTEGENPFPATQNVGWATLWSGSSGPTQYSAVQNIPFPFVFNGDTVSKYVAGNFGTVTFSSTVPTVKPDNFGSLALPNASIPDNSVCILGGKPRSAAGTGITYTSAVMSKTYGTAPNRQHWVWFNFFGEDNIQNGWTYWAIVLEEGTNDIYIVDMKTLCVNAQGQLCTNNVKMSAGIQVTSSPSEVYTVAGSPNLEAKQITQNLFTPEDNSFYRFSVGTNTNSVRAVNVVFEEFNLLKNAPFGIKARIQNHGSVPLNNVEASYQINGGDWVDATINTTALPAGSYTEISHNTNWSPTETGSYLINFRVKNPNGEVDLFEDDDMVSKTVQVVDTFVNKRLLLEVFSSSTCGPCRPGNIQLKSVTDQMGNQDYSYIKYQYNFPGTGDPYYTLECRDRGTYYGGISAVPTTVLGGLQKINPNGATLSMLQNAQKVPSFVDIDANAKIIWKDNLTFDVSIMPYVDLPAGTKLHVAIVEGPTFKNAKSNGETEFNNVLKKFAYGANGKSLPALPKGEMHTESGNYQFNGVYRLPPSGQSNIINWNSEHSIENFHNLKIVVFLQNDITQEVLQSFVQSVSLSLSVNETEAQKALQVYPNPATDNLTVSFDKANKAVLTLKDIQGKSILTQDVDFEGGSNVVTLPVGSLAKGMYLLTVNADGINVTKKVMVTE